MPQLARILDGKKFLWNGVEYEARKQAEEASSAYEKEAFETRMIEEGGKHLIYTRRVAAQQTATETPVS
ncbi:MAG: hypothetical protein HY922_15180 [Elusimicrobia bacterium]|nr:hypothetical protein [Elusimicrobiota bacterium]